MSGEGDTIALVELLCTMLETMEVREMLLGAIAREADVEVRYEAGGSTLFVEGEAPEVTPCARVTATRGTEACAVFLFHQEASARHGEKLAELGKALAEGRCPGVPRCPSCGLRRGHAEGCEAYQAPAECRHRSRLWVRLADHEETVAACKGSDWRSRAYEAESILRDIVRDLDRGGVGDMIELEVVARIRALVYSLSQRDAKPQP